VFDAIQALPTDGEFHLPTTCGHASSTTPPSPIMPGLFIDELVAALVSLYSAASPAW
jgi:hypothetical protein